MLDNGQDAQSVVINSSFCRRDVGRLGSRRISKYGSNQWSREAARLFHNFRMVSFQPYLSLHMGLPVQDTIFISEAYPAHTSALYSDPTTHVVF